MTFEDVFGATLVLLIVGGLPTFFYIASKLGWLDEYEGSRYETHRAAWFAYNSGQITRGEYLAIKARHRAEARRLGTRGGSSDDDTWTGAGTSGF